MRLPPAITALHMISLTLVVESHTMDSEETVENLMVIFSNCSNTVSEL